MAVLGWIAGISMILAGGFFLYFWLLYHGVSLAEVQMMRRHDEPEFVIAMADSESDVIRSRKWVFVSAVILVAGISLTLFMFFR